MECDAGELLHSRFEMRVPVFRSSGCSNTADRRDGHLLAHGGVCQPYGTGSVQSLGEPPARESRLCGANAGAYFRAPCVKAFEGKTISTGFQFRRAFAQGVLAEGEDLRSNLLWSSLPLPSYRSEG
jgi:hypothetical protein